MSGTEEIDESGSEKPETIPFSGAVDATVAHDLDSAFVGESVVMLFTSEGHRPPRKLGFDGLPLHRTFFESAGSWSDARQLICERIRDVRMIGVG